MTHKERIERAAETIGEPSDWAKLIAERVVVAYLGDKVLYEIGPRMLTDDYLIDGFLERGVLVQVYPEVDE